MASKHVAHFLEEFTSWRVKLSTVEAVITVWLEVQRTWSHLESIFIGSQDIRAQLPQDSKRFDSINDTFSQMMNEAVGVPNIIVNCCQPGLLENFGTPA